MRMAATFISPLFWFSLRFIRATLLARMAFSRIIRVLRWGVTTLPSERSFISPCAFVFLTLSIDWVGERWGFTKTGKTSMTADEKPLLRYFVSHEHKKDGEYKKDLMERLQASLDNAKGYRFELWDDEEIDPGERWHDTIQKAIRECNFGLLLVSKYFLASKYIREHELPAFVSPDPDQPAENKRAVPVALQPLDFSGKTDLKGLEQHQVFMHKGKAYSQQSSTAAKEDFADALYQKILRIAERSHSTIVPSPLPGEKPQINKPEIIDAGPFGAEVRACIANLLRKPQMLPVLNFLCPKAVSADQGAAVLVPEGANFDPHQAVLNLHKASYEGLKRCAESSHAVLREALESVEEIFGRFMLLMVSDEWVAEQREGASDAVVAVISVNEEAVMELASARIRKHQGRWSLDPTDEQHLKVKSRSKVDLGSLEVGFGPQALPEVKKLFWQKYFPGSNPLERTGWEEELRTHLEIDFHTYGKSHFLSVTGQNALDPSLHNALARELPSVGVFVSGQGGKEVLRKMIPEPRLVATVRAFLLMLDEFRKKLT